ncbi:lytic transglycosylase domain-containing protein [Acinetobacter sp. WCHAc060033]|uniref:lytic transglycosylase domain-containing protein n=1 Tax=Acinetobacter sp. WCHAc060033 TaxID=2518624 RepID=UPI001023DAB0|nr:lytic transglycosylase domain-containing protein [Acinetobacter sp. WCHAc060033]RZG78694.1 lytic transglycosylase domain-containing protein [Acinetobacter sp. WCHAc060033]
MATKLGSLTLDLIAKVSSFTGPMQEAENKAKSAGEGIAESMDIASVAVKSLGVAAAGVSIAGITNFANQTIQAGSDIKRFAELSNSSLQQFQYYAKGAETAGFSMEKFADVSKDVLDRLGEVSRGEGEMMDFFERIAPKIGVTAAQFKNLSGPDALQAYYNGLQKANLSHEEQVTYMEQLANDASLLIPLLKNGGEGFNKWGNAAKEAGAIMSDDFVQSAVLAKEQLNLLNLKWEGFKNNAINDFAVPAITGLSSNLETITNTLMISTAYMAGSYIPTIYKSVLAQKVKIGTIIENIRAEQLANEITAQRTARIAHLSTMELANAEAQLARMSGMARVAYLEKTVLPLRQANTAALAADTIAQNANNASKSLAVRVGSTLSGVLGGPIGLGVMAASAAAGFLLMKDSSKDTQSALEDQGLSVDELKVKYSQLNAEQLKLKALDAADAIEEQNEKIASSLTSLKQYISDLNAQGKTSEASSLQQYLDDLKTGGERAETAFSRLEKQSIVSPHSLKMAAQVGTNVKASNTEIEKQNQILSIASNKHIDHAKAAKTGAEGVALVGKEAVGAASKVKNLGEEVQKFINDTLNSTTDNLRKYQLISQGYSAATADMILAAEKVEGINGKGMPLSVFSISALATQVLSQKRLTDLTDARIEAEKKVNDQLKEQAKALKVNALVASNALKANATALETANKLPKGLLSAVNMVESPNSNTATSPVGAGGPMQFMPTTADQYKVDIKSVESSYKGASKYLKDLLKMFDGDLENALRAYNWGQGNMQNFLKYGSGMKKVGGKWQEGYFADRPMPKETREYSGKVMSYMAGASGQKFDASYTVNDYLKSVDSVTAALKKLEDEKKTLIEFYDDWQKLENNNSEQVKKIREAFAKDPKAMEYYLSLQAQAYQKDVENYIRAGDDRVKAEYQATQEIIAARQAAYNSLNDPIYAMRDKGVESRAQASMTPMQYQSWQLNSEQQEGYSQLGNDLMDAVNAINESQILSEQEKYDQLKSAHKDYVNSKSALDVLYDKQTKDLARSQQIEQVNMWGGILSTGQNTFSQLAQSAKDGLGEQSSTYRTMFAMQQAFSVASSMVAAWTAYTTAFADPSAMTLTQKFAGGAAVMAALMPALTTIGSISIQGMAHNGIDNIPSEGTWLLDGGERVLNPQQNKDLTRYLSESRSNQNTQSAQVSVNPQIVILDERKAMGDYLQSREGEQIILKTLKRNGYAR